MPGGGPVSRSAEWVQREYGSEKWPAIERAIERVCADESVPPDPARVVGRVAREEMGVLPAEAEVIVNGRVERLPRNLVTGAYQSLVVGSVLDHCTEQTDLVIELGSGWGRNLLSLWLGGGPRQARYVAAEYTEAGRRASTRLAELVPTMTFGAVPFDYRSPDLSSVAVGRHAVVFTAHSIEQVDELPDSLVPAILETAASVTCIHFEPVGWQLDGNGLGSSAEYALQHDYNVNLLPRLREHAEQGQITIEETVPEVFGLNPSNATTLVRWTSAT